MTMLDNFGEQIEDFEVYDLLGKGGFACVYRAKCRRTGIHVAIKMIDKKMMQSAGMANRVRQEVSIHSRLKHPSILELYTFFEDANYVYLVLELAENGELQRYLRETKKTFSEHEAATVLKQVVEGLLYLHSNHILHRDMSLANLLLTKHMTLKISDFGLATQLSRPDEKHMTLCGTPNYISPEVASRASHGLPADVWGLGCMLYTFLVGKPPFDTAGVKSTLTKVVMSNYNVPSYISQEARDLIDQLLKKNPAERMRLEQVLQHPFMRKALDKGHSSGTTLASTDSGIITMSSSGNRSNIPSSHCQERYQPMANHQMPLRYQPISEHEQHFQESILPPRSRSASCQETSDFYSGLKPSSRVNSAAGYQQTNQISLLQQFNSLELMEKYNINKAEIESVGRSNSGGSLQQLHGQLDFQPQLVMGAQQISLLDAKQKSASVSKLYQLASEIQPQSANYFYCDEKENRPNEQVETAMKGEQVLLNPGNYSRENHNAYQIAPRQNSPKQQSKKMLDVPPLTTTRLLPNRHKTKNAILSIQSNGEVVLEFIKHKPRYREERVFDVCRISSDGLRFVLYHPDGGKGAPVKDEPPDLPVGGADNIFSYENLPEKHWKKYLYAARFVQMVKAKTPKITYYSEKAKCQLMETLEDFEAMFYSGTKIVKTSQEGIRIVDNNGKTVTNSANLNPVLNMEYQHFQKTLEHCLSIDQTLSAIRTGNTFPLIIGRRPASAALVSSKEPHNQSNPCTPQTPMSPHQLSSFAMSVNSHDSEALHNRRPVTRSKTAGNFSNVAIKKCTIPGIGTAVQLSQGVIQVHFLDGAALSLIPTEQGGGVTFSPSSGSPLQHYATQDDASLPRALRDKIASMPHILRQLNATVAPSIPFNFLEGTPRTPLTRFLR
ncbi:serine/threonine-protein kinase PLK4 isoform X2 [Wyeomyia smithii]|uniref:serine/threonine-protein kinase PLK4 isoform X2 n=1 Tax=Wyeomyia smithii TaxID=174621 RepID=UPI002467AEBE|nr:serine/threonine-protein kinase PLK4 isoform X2 [Wyeomyia smithii]